MPSTDLLRPIITEKSLRLASNGKFSFYITRRATKAGVKQAVETQFSVNVLKINIVSLPAKARRSGKKRLAMVTNWRKKAIATLKPGQSIEYFKLPEEKNKNKKKPASTAKRGE